MQIFDLKNMPSLPYAERQKNVFFQRDEFKTRIIDLKAGEVIPPCQMESYVLFYVISGSAQVTVNHDSAELSEGRCLIAEPSTLSMQSPTGVRMLGIQIALAS